MTAGKSLVIAVIGDESLAVHCALAARDAGDEVVALATRAPAVRDEAAGSGLTVVEPDRLADVLSAGSVDVLFSIANERVLPDDVIGAVAHAVNFHDGPLPAYAGLGVTTWAIHAGEPAHGVSWHRMTAEVDNGEVLLADSFPIADDDTALSLNARCYEAGLATFPLLLDRLRTGAPADAPGTAPVRFFARDERPLVWIDPAVPAADLARGVRALDLGPRIRNRMGSARWVVDGRHLLVGAATALPGSGSAPGTVLSVDDHGIRMATVDGDLLLSGLTAPDGRALAPAEAAAQMRIAPGATVPGPPAASVDALAAEDRHLARQETHWIERLTTVDATVPPHLAVPAVAATASPATTTFDVAVPAGSSVDELLAVVVLWWARSCGSPTASFSFEDPTIAAPLARLHPVASPPVGRVVVDASAGFDALVRAIGPELERMRSRGPHLADLAARVPSLRGHEVRPPLHLRVGADATTPGPHGQVVVDVAADAAALTITAHVDPEEVPGWRRVAGQIRAVLDAARAAPTAPVHGLPLLDAVDAATLAAVNDTSRDHDRTSTLDAALRAQVARTPDAPALSCAGTTLSYAELGARVDAFAAQLRSAGAGPGGLVGIALPRGADLVVAVLATLASGAAYVPLDPEYPDARLRFMVTDAELAALVADRDTADRLGVHDRPVLHPADGGAHSDAVDPTHGPEDAAYVIYTSGSTGTPKGVVVEHRNVVNFFAGMDDVIGTDPPGTWLAVTSLSFDISVLELLWTLTRGFHVVVQQRTIGSTPSARTSAGRRAPSWSLFYFAAGHEQAAEGYRLLLESARFADERGFEAVWIPERHFHDFGGAYPNPSVAAAAVAAITRRVGIRAGSVVLPLHATPRVAEEWALVDNLSGGRVGISFAPGWQPRDFVLNPAAHGTARADLPRRIDEVRALWRGDPVEMPGHDGEPIAVSTLPRPVQAELPTWLTSAGTTATFEQAGRAGMNLLTHLLGQSVEQLEANVAVYRRAWSEAGHAGHGHVTLMLHTYLDEDPELARSRAEGPMKGYLSSATGLIKNMASAFPTFANAGADADEAFRSLSPAEMDELLSMAAERYMATSGLFGTAASAADVVDRLADVGVDEVACLIDFGVPTEDVLRSLEQIDAAKRLVDERRGSHDGDEVVGADAPETAAALVARHGVTHLQCTPSLAEILLADPDDRAALAGLRHLMVGGEALPEALATELADLVDGRLTNMYGPTETTIWSLVHEVDGPPGGPVPIGRPIANTTVHVLDAAGAVLPVGALGELHIGGEGVTRGYLRRPELTAERFVDRPGLGRLYATGDLASIRDDGIVEFAGRVDFQVKIRGHRIELGEIEAVLDAQPDVDRAVVVARGSGGAARLVAFVRPVAGRTVDAAALMDHLRTALPSVMVPDAVGVLDDLPLTPNGKIDRNALPASLDVASRTLDASEQPAGDVESLVAEAWSTRLQRPIGRSDNVFDVGGNSLLAVAVFRHLQAATSLPLVLTDLFRYPTVAALAGHLASLSGAPAGDGEAAPAERAPTGTDRGALRRQARGRRGGA